LKREKKETARARKLPPKGYKRLLVENLHNQEELGRFCRRMGRETNQGEVGLVVRDEYLAIRDFTEE